MEASGSIPEYSTGASVNATTYGQDELQLTFAEFFLEGIGLLRDPRAKWAKYGQNLLKLLQFVWTRAQWVKYGQNFLTLSSSSGLEPLSKFGQDYLLLVAYC